jgi:predicted short-subunit dehydrogenase-like oxidoreductase (DUF2520 family)
VALAARAAVVHCAGAMDGTVLAPLGVDRVGQMHPLVSFASRRASPPLEGATMRLAGAARAKTLGRRVALLLRMRPRELDGLDPTLYHAAAALCASGAAALVAASARMLQVGGVPSDEAIALLAPLLSSVAHNVEALGLPEALTGPVRRGDTIAIAAHLRLVTRHAPELVPLLEALIAAQLPMARALGEAPVENFDAIAVTLAR